MAVNTSHTKARTKLLSRLAKVEGEYAVARDQEKQIATHADQMTRGIRALTEEMGVALRSRNLPRYLALLAQRRRLDHTYQESRHER